MKRLKVGQLGIGHNHAEGKLLSARKFPEMFEIVGYCEENEDWVAKRGGLAVYDGIPRLNREELTARCDAVFVETDVCNLTREAQFCIDAGKHIHMDKPASGTLSEYEKLLGDAERKGLTVQLGYMYRYNPAVQKCLELYRSGALGEIYSINAEMSTMHPPEYRNWLRRFDGGIMYILGSHLIDLAVLFLGEPNEVISLLKHTGRDGVDVPDNTQAILGYDRAMARINVSSVEWNGWGRRQLVVAGSRGTVEIRPMEVPTVMTLANAETSPDAYLAESRVIPVEDLPGNCRYDAMLRDFYECAVNGKELPFGFKHELAVQRTILRVLNGECQEQRKTQ